MSENKKNKDSYAKDTLEFEVPPEQLAEHSRSMPEQGMYPGGQYPQGQYPQGQRPQGQHPQGQRPQGQHPQRQHPQGQHPQRQYPQGQHPQRQHPQGQHPQNPGASRKPKTGSSGNVRKKPVQKQADAGKRKSVSAKTKRPGKKRGGGCLKRIIFSVLGVFAVLFGIYSFIVMSLINKINIVDTKERIQPEHSVLNSSSVRNILLIGADSRGDDRGRSDSMILLSINSKTNKITMCSLMRDMYVQIPGYGGNKLNAAYSYGGPELLMDTIEENLYINIDDYVTVNFMSFANIVDSVGGVEIEISDSEADAMNTLLQSPEGISFFGEPSEDDLLYGGGTYNLSGKQALCYSRLRYVGNADFERTERQRKVLSAIIKKAVNPLNIGSVAKEALPSMDTNMGKLNMYLLSLRAPFLIGYDIEQMRIPADDTYWGSDIDGMSVLEVDFNSNIDMIEDKLYGN